MKIRQRAHFDIVSDVMPAVEVTARLGLASDEVLVRGSRSVDPPRPARHMWKIHNAEPGLRVDEQIERVVARLEPIAEEIGDLVDELSEQGRGRAVLQVARFFDDPDGEEDDGYYGVEIGSGQHQLLGWHLDSRVLEFLCRTRAELDVDEYG